MVFAGEATLAEALYGGPVVSSRRGEYGGGGEVTGSTTFLSAQYPDPLRRIAYRLAPQDEVPIVTSDLIALNSRLSVEYDLMDHYSKAPSPEGCRLH